MAMVQGTKRLANAPQHPALGNLLTKVREILDAAQQVAVEICNKAEVTVANERERLIKEGYNHGVRLALKELWSERDTLKEAFESSREEILSLSVKFAEELVGERISAPEGLIKRIEQAISHCLTETHCTLYLHPEVLPDLRDSVLSRYGRQLDLNFKTDPNLKRNDARIETAVGTIETSLSNQLMALAYQIQKREFLQS